jgi:cytochrome bd-type quinol oxidase subunit 2
MPPESRNLPKVARQPASARANSRGRRIPSLQFSIGKLMLLVAVCGLNFFLLSMIGRDPKEYGVNQLFGELILLGGLPMVDVLAVVALVRRPGRRSVDGFLLAGCLALGLYLGIAAMFPEAIRDGLIAVLNAVIPLGPLSLFTMIGRITLVILLNLGPQLAVAALLARPMDRFLGRIAARADSDPQSLA